MFQYTFDLDNPVPKSSIKIPAQQITDEFGLYRILAGERVRYLTIGCDVFDEGKMCMPSELISNLPMIPADGEWKQMGVKRSSDQHLIDVSIHNHPLPTISTAWHPRYVDALTLPRKVCRNSEVYETVYKGKPAVMKVINFAWCMFRLERESWAYSVVDAYMGKHPDEERVVPRFLAHLTEHGRAIGCLLEMVEGRHATIDDLPVCEALLQRLHKMGLVHGDINKHNFIIDENNENKGYLLDLEHAVLYNEKTAELELQELAGKLEDESGDAKPRCRRVPKFAEFGEVYIEN